MTILVWDGKTLAADRLECWGNRKTECPKIYKYAKTGTLITGSGSIAATAALRHWFLTGADPTAYPACQKSKEDWGRLVIINPDCRVYVYESEPVPYEVLTPPAVFGSGSDFAFGALAMGADARRAVEAVNSICTDCGIGVDYAQPGLVGTEESKGVQWL